MQSESQNSKKLDLIIPCFNEEGNIAKLFERVVFAKAQCPNLNVIFVDNGSHDGTFDLLTSLVAGSGVSGVRIIRVSDNQGYGHGIKFGLEHATGDFVGWTHADLQCDPFDAVRALEVAYRAPGPVFVKGKRFGRPLSDRIFTTAMTVFETLLFRKKLNDINAQPTIFSKEILDDVMRGPSDFGLDLYSFVIAHQLNLKIMRIPVRFGKRYSGQSNWNTSMRGRYRFIRRTLQFSFALVRGKSA